MWFSEFLCIETKDFLVAESFQLGVVKQRKKRFRTIFFSIFIINSLKDDLKHF